MRESWHVWGNRLFPKPRPLFDRHFEWGYIAIGYHYSTERHGTEWHIPWHYSPERNRADTRVPQRINYSISYLVAMGVLERLDL